MSKMCPEYVTVKRPRDDLLTLDEPDLLIMVARSSDSESDLPLYFTAAYFILFYFLPPHFLRRRKTDIPETFPQDVA